MGVPSVFRALCVALAAHHAVGLLSMPAGVTRSRGVGASRQTTRHPRHWTTTSGHAGRAGALRMSSTTTMEPEVATKVAAVNPAYGDTAGAMIKMENGVLSRGDTELIADMHFTIMPGDRVALVGQNGAGKSTLLSAVAGMKSLDEGSLRIKNGQRVGYLIQTAVSGSTRTVYEEACSQMDHINEARAEMDKAEEEMVAGVEVEGADIAALMEKFTDAQAQFQAVGGPTQEKTVAGVLSGLGFTVPDQERNVSEFSGGWQMRIALARMLLSSSDMLLLDEPSNHLDMKSKRWLRSYLAKYDGTIVTVSHDEELLEGLDLTTVIEVRSKRLEFFKGFNWRTFKTERIERVKRAQAQYEQERREIAHLQKFVDRWGAQATKATAAQSRVKQIAKLEANAIANPEGDLRMFQAAIKLPAPPACAVEQLELKKAAYGWDADPIVSDVDLKVEKGNRLAILGPNGCGKSTTLKALAGMLDIKSGERKVGSGVKMGVFTQDLAQDLPQERVALDLVLERVRQHDASCTDQVARSTLGALGLTGPKALRKIGWLSGGEKARVALAIFVLIPYNVLLLDEPSNHLDAETLDSLVNAVKKWPGTAIVVSHNQAFVEAMRATHVAVVKQGKLHFYDRPPEPEDWIWTEEAGGDATATIEASKVPAKVLTKEEKRAAEQERKKIAKIPSRITRIQSILDKVEKEVEGLEADMIKAGTDLDKTMALSEKAEKKKKEVERLYSEWDELEAVLAEQAGADAA